MAELVDALVSDASGATRGSSSLLDRTKIMNKKPYTFRRRNKKIVALIIEIALLVTLFTILTILDGIGVQFNMIPFVIIMGVIIFALFLTLSLLRYDAMRDIRTDDSFKSSNLPLFTDPTTLQGHDIVEERQKDS